MKKFLLRMAAPLLLAIIEPALRDALKQEVKVPARERELLNAIGMSNATLDAVDARVQTATGDRVMREIDLAVSKAVQ